MEKIETLMESASIEREIAEAEAKLAGLAQRRGTLAFLARRDSVHERELEEVRAEIQRVEAHIAELRGALGAARAEDAQRLTARRQALVDKMARTLEDLESERDGAIKEARREQDGEQAACAFSLARAAYGLASSLKDLTGDRSFTRTWDIRARLGELAKGLVASDHVAAEVVCQVELAEVKAIDTQLANLKGGK